MNKVHAKGLRKIGTHHQTACNAYMAEGRGAVATTDDLEQVTCKACLKALGR